MTIFLKIVKEILHVKIFAIRDMSLNADGSLLNQGLTLVGEGRDLELSSAKRELLENTLLLKISGLVGSDNDMTNLGQLQALIIACRREAKSKSVDKGYDEGASGPAIQKLVDLLQSIFDKLAELKVLNTPHEGDPLHVFHYFLASYCAQKIAADHDLGFIVRLAKNPLVSTSRKLAKEKNDLVLAAIDECSTDLNCLDPKNPGYPAAREKTILTCIDKLRRDNRTLCVDNAKFFGVFFQPSLGVLEECMAKAVTDITKSRGRSASSASSEPTVRRDDLSSSRLSARDDLAALDTRADRDASDAPTSPTDIDRAVPEALDDVEPIGPLALHEDTETVLPASVKSSVESPGLIMPAPLAAAGPEDVAPSKPLTKRQQKKQGKGDAQESSLTSSHPGPALRLA